MARGKEYTEEERQEIINELEELFALGYSIEKACNLIGFSPTTLRTWLKTDEALRRKIIRLQNEMTIQARKTIRKQIMENKTISDSYWWVERKEKDEFSTRQETMPLDKTRIEEEDERLRKYEKEIFNDIEEDDKQTA